MKCLVTAVVLFICPLGPALMPFAKPSPSNIPPSRESLFEAKLDKRLERFDTAGRTLIASVVDLAYEYELPMGIEYLDRDATNRPINLEFHNESVRNILVAITQQESQYRISFSGGIVSIYAPEARKAPLNLLNKTIKNYRVSSLDTQQANMQLFCALARELEPSSGCGGNTPLGQWSTVKITLRLEEARVYEILNAIVAQNGNAIWTTIVPPEKLSQIQIGGLWHIWPLRAPFKAVVLAKLNHMQPEPELR